MKVIDKFLSYLAADRGYSPSTILTYQVALEDFERYFRNLDAELDWATLDADVIRRWMAQEMGQGITARTISKKLSALNSLYKYLLRMGLVTKNPTSLATRPKLSKPLPAFVKESDMDRLFDEVVFPTDYEGQRDRTILLLFYHTGIRVSELMGLDLADVSFQPNELKVTGKRNKQRIVPFGEELADALRRYLQDRRECRTQSVALFLNAKGNRVPYDTVRLAVRKYLSLVTTQKKKSPHVLRHTFATVMLNHGADLEAIKELLGHEDISTTEVYTHTTFAELKKEYEQAHPRA